ncbi:MAG: hypothetical protein Q9227_000805 [Pyrenula ochraceoflavens]
MPAQPSSVSEISSNLLGALLFLFYILAALLFTALILSSLLNTYSSLPSPSYRRKGQGSSTRSLHIQIFAALSTLSFATLSYHMLNVLFSSYDAWLSAHSIHRVTPPSSPFYACTTSSDLALACAQQAWLWARTSRLFQDFATDLVSTRERWFWVQGALCLAMGWSLYMAGEARRRGGRIPRLWAYWVIMQILPGSFGWELFCLAVLLHDEGEKNVVVEKVGEENENEPVDADQRGLFGGVVVVLGFLVAVGWVARGVGREAEMWIVGLVRAGLFLPYMALRSKAEGFGTSRERMEMKSVIKSPRIALLTLFPATMVMQGWLLMRIWRDGGSVQILFLALDEKPAVSALGYDFWIGLVSTEVWCWR